MALVDSIVFVCRGGADLSAINVKDPANLVTMYTRTDGNYVDVIHCDNMLICYVQTDVVIYVATDLGNLNKFGMVNF